MDKEVFPITNEGETTLNEWENDESDFLWILYSVENILKS